jgi:S-formylglutathione hydrolase FrmB
MRALLLLLLVACSNSPSTPVAPTTSDPAPAVVAKPERRNSQVVTERFHATALGVDKDVRVYLPAGYDPADARRYPVFYYLHGLGGDEANWLDGAKLDRAADALGLEAIVVMPDGDNNFYIDSAIDPKYDACLKDGEGMFLAKQPRQKTCVKTSKYETYMTRDLIDWVDRTYKTIATRDARGIAGLSMGGFGALVLSMRHPDLYAAAASHSGLITPLYKGPYPYVKGKGELHTSYASVAITYKMLGDLGTWVNTVFGSDFSTWQTYNPIALAQKLTPGALALYLDCGTEDEFLFNHSVSFLHDVLLERGIQHEFYLGPGRHSFELWRARVTHSLTYLRDHLAKPN